MSERDARIGPTAYYTSYVWHRLGMPYADWFASERGRRLFWTFRLSGEWLATQLPGVPSMEQYLELRHRALERVLEEAQPDAVVELGAGLSRRGVTWALDRDTRYVEVDLPHMIDEKRRLLARAASAEQRARLEARLEHRALDVLGDDFALELRAAFGAARAPVVLAEGLLGYFPMDERRRLVEAIAVGLRDAGGGVFGCDLRAREGGARVAAAASVLRGAIWLVTRGRGVAEDFGSTDAVRDFFRAAGFDHAEPVAAPDVDRRLASIRSPARVWRATVGPVAHERGA
ncbi:MAG: class I SAM-dependent methyltransferase [Polyangiaceae bacterium]|nr:class I SAM-dependent methyltransferase [Polyangiaceae bacterium]